MRIGLQNTLAMMELLAGGRIPRKSTKSRSKINSLKEGDLNKICIGCGHKNKKCTC